MVSDPECVSVISGKVTELAREVGGLVERGAFSY